MFNVYSCVTLCKQFMILVNFSSNGINGFDYKRKKFKLGPCAQLITYKKRSGKTKSNEQQSINKVGNRVDRGY